MAKIKNDSTFMDGTVIRDLIDSKSTFSGSYNDLTNKPTIPPEYTHPSTHPASMITGLATVATSGSYNDLSNLPTIPEAYTLPTASATVLGGVKVGSGLKITDGVLSATGGGGGGSADFGPWAITPDENGNLNFIYNG